jgi:hypothetical protein
MSTALSLATGWTVKIGDTEILGLEELTFDRHNTKLVFETAILGGHQVVDDPGQLAVEKLAGCFGVDSIAPFTFTPSSRESRTLFASARMEFPGGNDENVPWIAHLSVTHDARQ